jgi:hypothetical protein
MARRWLLFPIILIAACASPPTPSTAPTPAPTTSPISAPTPTAAPSPTATPAARVFGAADFTRTGGCGDVFVYATSPDDAMSVTIDWREAASSAWANNGYDGTKQIPDGELDVTLNVGRQLSDLYCTDIGMEGPRVDGTAHATSGQIEITVTPDAGGFEPASHADVSLHDVVFDVVQGAEVEHWRITDLVIENVSVGWFAG